MLFIFAKVFLALTEKLDQTVLQALPVSREKRGIWEFQD